MDEKNLLYFYSPIALLKRIEKTLLEIGSQRFFSNPDEETKRVKESVAEFFFMVALKKYNGKDWWMFQPKEQFPDFDLMTASQGASSISITLDRFELVTIPDRCATFEEALGIVQGKISKGYPDNYNLLIFVNHVKSREWVALLNQHLKNYQPFRSIWTVYLLFHGKDNPYSAVVNKVRPLPMETIEANFSDKKLWEMETLPIFMEEIEISGQKCRAFKPDFMKEFSKKMRQANLDRKKI